uniref:Uncharacterized protein n=1 Tax=Aotus nancymaae TaxID=37293 RepID=A0A2K5CEA1_AOTNA
MLLLSTITLPQRPRPLSLQCHLVSLGPGTDVRPGIRPRVSHFLCRNQPLLHQRDLKGRVHMALRGCCPVWMRVHGCPVAAQEGDAQPHHNCPVDACVPLAFSGLAFLSSSVWGQLSILPLKEK